MTSQVFDSGLLHALARVRMRATRASGDLPGNTRVRNRSDESGLEVERHVPYTPGDDLRRIDWNSYARLGELFTRRFVAEREVPVWIVIDTSASMGPAGAGSKLDMACAIAGIFAAIGLSSGNRVYVVTLPGTDGNLLGLAGPMRDRRRMVELRAFLTGVRLANGAGELVSGLRQALRGARQGVVVLISDFLYEPGTAEALFDTIATRRCEGKIVHLLSREDYDPAWLRGSETLLDRETGATWRIRPSAETWRRYQDALFAHLARIRDAAAARAMSLTLTISDIELRLFLTGELPRLGLRLVR